MNIFFNRMRDKLESFLSIDQEICLDISTLKYIGLKMNLKI